MDRAIKLAHPNKRPIIIIREVLKAKIYNLTLKLTKSSNKLVFRVQCNDYNGA